MKLKSHKGPSQCFHRKAQESLCESRQANAIFSQVRIRNGGSVVIDSQVRRRLIRQQATNALQRFLSVREGGV